MGDRCSVDVILRAKDVKKFQDRFGDVAADTDVDDIQEGFVHLYFNEQDCGNLAGLDDAARAGLMFVGTSGSGANYGATHFCGRTGKVYTCEAGSNGGLCVEVKLAANKKRYLFKNLTRVDEFMKAYLKACKSMGLDPPKYL